MTTIVYDALLGPHSRGAMIPYDDASPTTFYLDDSNDSIAWSFIIPKTGTITDIGFFISYKSGTPPTYKTGISPLTTASGFPSPTGYGGSSIENFNYTSLGWQWVTLSTPASAIAGDSVCVQVYPGAVAPTVSNRIGIPSNTIYPDDQYFIPGIQELVTGPSWTHQWGGFGYFAIRYDNGDIYGVPIKRLVKITITTETTPDEVGCKFTLPFDANCIGPSISFDDATNNNTGLKIILYDSGDAILRSITFLDTDELTQTYSALGGYKRELRWSSPVSLTKDTTYRLTLQNLTSLSGIVMWGVDFFDSNSRSNNLLGGLTDWNGTVRTDSGAWTDFDTIVYDMGIVIDSISYETTPPSSGAGGAYAYVS